MNKVARVVALLSILLAVSARAETSHVLVPIAITSAPLHGAFGSIWTTELVARNDSDSVVEVGPLGPCFIPEGCGTLRAPHSTFRPGGNAADPNAGLFLAVGLPEAITFELRVQDISRQGQTWGTAIPVVRDKDVFTSTLKLLDVTVDRRFRSTLRIYRFDTFTDFPPAVRVRIYDLCGLSPIDRNCSSTPIAETTLVLRKTENDPNHPDFAMIGNLVDAFPQLTNVQPIDLPPLNYFRPAAVRIEIEPLTADLRFWAFVSVTNNETQHVTVITPQ